MQVQVVHAYRSKTYKKGTEYPSALDPKICISAQYLLENAPQDCDDPEAQENLYLGPVLCMAYNVFELNSDKGKIVTCPECKHYMIKLRAEDSAEKCNTCLRSTL